MFLRKSLLLLTVMLLAMPVLAEKGGKGQGAGGLRDEHVSEMGMEKGKAYAGERDVADEPGKPDKEVKSKKEKKEKKEEKLKEKVKKEKKEKKEKKQK